MTKTENICGQKIIKIVLYLSSIYMILSAIISLFIIIQGLLTIHYLNIVSSLSIVTAVSIILLTIGNNCSLLLSKNMVLKSNIIINLIVCSIQSISIFSEGFCYKYTQGFEWVGYVHFDLHDGKTDFGAFISTLVFEFIFNFKTANGVMLGTNFFTLLLVVFFGFVLKGIIRIDHLKMKSA